MASSQLDPHDPVSPAGPNPVAAALKAVLRPLASLRLTVTLLAMAVVLVFFGTLAQKTAGIWTTVDKYFWSWIVMIDLQPTLEFLKIFFGLSKDATVSSSIQIPFPAGKLIGGLMFLNLIAAHSLRFKLSWKRAGIWLTHGGLLLLFVGEFITREFQVEQRMTIAKNESVNFSEDSRLVELAFTTPDTEGTARVTVIPGKTVAEAARTHRRITHPDLPVDVQVDTYMVNSSSITVERLAARKTELVGLLAALERFPLMHEGFIGSYFQQSVATLDDQLKSVAAMTGLGTKYVAEPKPEVSGVGEQTLDLPSAYVTLYKKGTDEKVGTYLVSLWFTYNSFDRDSNPTQAVKTDGVAHDLALRFTRYYKPFSLHLVEFRFDRYTGTQEAKNYSSDLILIDNDRGQERAVRVSMNDPLFYRGETFYQQTFDAATESITVLQVVRNPGWILPYAACVMVGLGLLFHFILGLTQYLRRQTGARAEGSEAEAFTLLVAVLAVGALMVRFGLIAEWLDGVIGPVGGISSLFGGTGAFLFGATLAPAVGLYLLMRRARGPHVPLVAAGEPSTLFERKMPWLAVGLGASMLLGAAWPRSNPGSMDIRGAARLPVVDGGRVKPLDTVARVLLRKISAKEEFLGSDGKMHPAIEWLLDAMASPNASGPAFKHKVIRIENEQVLTLLGLERREGYRYSLEEIAPKIGDLQRAMDKARPREGMAKPPADARIDNLFESGDRDVFAAQVMETAERVEMYVKLCNRTIPLTVPPANGKEWQSLADALEAAQRAALLDTLRARGLLPKDLDTLTEEEAQQFDTDARRKMSALLASTPGLLQQLDMIVAYRGGDSTKFATSLAAYRDATADAVTPTDRAKVQFEVFLNEFAPAYQVIYLYVLAGVLALAGWVAIGFRQPLATAFQKSSFWLLVVTFVVHGFALFSRMYLMDRPLVFVTNLYSTAVFIGWSAVGLGLVMERIAPIGLGNLAAAVVGGATAIIAHNLATSGDTLQMMVAVLDTNFWLATHVTTINLGYAATYIAGVIGIIYLVLGIFTPTLSMTAGVGAPGAASRRDTLGRLLGQLMYGVLCLATLLSFVGTVLGGIWADYSWGRFWGWDPKENGAVLIVLWNALILHARWCGLVKDRGIAVLTLGGIIITTWSYFGTNQLGVGLHNYGFNKTLAEGCKWTWLVCLGLMAIGCLPLKYWRSFADSATPRAATAASATTAAPVAGPKPTVNGTHTTNGTQAPPGAGKGKKFGKRR